jgi:glycyl-tRNA synthetase beta chain
MNHDAEASDGKPAEWVRVVQRFPATGTIAGKAERVKELARLFALHTGADPFEAQAVADHYKPDSDTSSPALVAAALADGIDTLAGVFLIGEKPTGVHDPLGSRPTGTNVIRLILENKVRVLMWTMISRAVAAYGKSSTSVAKEVLDFLIDRLKVHLREQGARHDLIAAAMGRAEDDLVRLVARVGALGDFLATEDGKNLLTAYRRAANILRIEEAKDKTRHTGDVDPALLAAPEERALAQAIAETSENSSAARSAEDFAGAMTALAGLRAPVDAFFDKVTVNADDTNLRVNRLKLLSGITKAMDRVADFSKVEG